MSSFPIDLDGGFYTDGNSKQVESISLFGNRSNFGTNFLEITPSTVFNGLADSRSFRLIVGVPNRFPVNEDIPAPTGITRDGTSGTFSTDDTTGSYFATFFDGVDVGYDTTVGTTHTATIPDISSTTNVQVRFTTETNDGGERGPWSEVFSFTGNTLTGTEPLPEAPTIVFESLSFPYAFGGTDVEDDVRAYLDFLEDDGLGTAPTFFPVQFTDESLVQPLDMLNQFGTVAGTLDLPPPPIEALNTFGVPRGILDMARPLNIPQMRGQIGDGISDSVGLRPAPLGMSDTFGALKDTIELSPGLKLRFSASFGTFDGQMNLPPPPMGAVENVALGILSAVNLKAPVLRITTRVTNRRGFRDSVNLARPLNIPGLSGTFGGIEYDVELTRPLNIPRMVDLMIFPFDGQLNLPGVGLKLTGTFGAMTDSMVLSAPAIRITDSVFDGIADRVVVTGGINEPFFRFVPDYTTFQRRAVSIDLPHIANEVESGSYTVTGLPDGLTYDPDTHRITGMVTANTGEYQVTITYTE